uniref:Uncharacterized protein n=1 Tax=Rhipicephalus appendiculatus TaxID=34631 RepID=A0A131YBK6_RHIAP
MLSATLTCNLMTGLFLSFLQLCMCVSRSMLTFFFGSAILLFKSHTCATFVSYVLCVYTLQQQYLSTGLMLSKYREKANKGNSALLHCPAFHLFFELTRLYHAQTQVLFHAAAYIYLTLR